MSSKSGNPIDAKREEFRKYLEREGILQSLTSVLVSLYEEPEKPKDGLLYLKNNFARGTANAGGGGPQNEEELEKLKEQNASLLQKIDDLEKQNSELQKELQSIRADQQQQQPVEESPNSSTEVATKAEPSEIEDTQKKQNEEEEGDHHSEEKMDSEQGSSLSSGEPQTSGDQSVPATTTTATATATATASTTEDKPVEESMDTSEEEAKPIKSEDPVPVPSDEKSEIAAPAT